MTEETQHIPVLSTRKIIQTWWPLAASWLLMAVELPALSAVVARLPDPTVNLAAWGGVVFPLALIIESPIIMLLAASTALSKDLSSYQWLRRFMMWTSATLTALHILISFTPLYDLVVVGLIGVPPEIVEPARIGMRLMTPWTWAIAYRRFNQGALIQFGHSEAVAIGTVIRLLADGVVLGLGLLTRRYPGIVVAGAAVSFGVISEAIYAGLRIRPVFRDKISPAPRVEEQLSLRPFLSFYVPLAMTSLLTLLVLPMGSAAISRMPRALDSLAVWPITAGFVFMLRSLGVAYNEVVVALLDEPGSASMLRRFALRLMVAMTVILVLVAGTPISILWFERVSALEPSLANLARIALWFALPLPGLNVLQSWFQGILLHARRTRGITEAVVLTILTSGVVLVVGVVLGRFIGLYVGWLGFSLGACFQMTWLWWRSRSALGRLLERDRVLQTAK